MTSASFQFDKQAISVDPSAKPSNLTGPVEVGLLYFFAFDGLFCIAWIIAMCCNYSIEFQRPLTVIRAVTALIGVFVILKAWMKSGRSFRCFAGMSWPILVFFVFVYCEMVLYNCCSGYRPPYYVLSYLVFPITVLAFSIPIDEKTVRKAFYCTYIPLFLIVSIALFNWYDWLYNGLTMRRHTFGIEEKHMIDSLWGGAYGTSYGAIGTFSALLGILSFSGWHVKWLPWPIFVVAYIAGSVLICFTAFKAIYLAWILVSITLFLGCGYWKRKISFLLVPFLIAANVLPLLWVGAKDPNWIPKRFMSAIQTSKRDMRDITQAVQEAKQDLSKTPQAALQTNQAPQPAPQEHVQSALPVVTQASQMPALVKNKSQPIAQQKDKHEEGLVKSPFSVMKKARMGTDVDYRALTAALRGNTHSRVFLNKLALEAMASNPVFGYGFSLVLKRGDEYVMLSPHCNIMIVFMGTGVVGGILFLVVIARGFLDSIIVMRRRPEFAWLAMIFIFAFVSNLTGTQVIYYNLLWIPLVVLRGSVRSISTTGADRDKTDFAAENPTNRDPEAG